MSVPKWSIEVVDHETLNEKRYSLGDEDMVVSTGSTFERADVFIKKDDDIALELIGVRSYTMYMPGFKELLTFLDNQEAIREGLEHIATPRSSLRSDSMELELRMQMARDLLSRLGE